MTKAEESEPIEAFVSKDELRKILEGLLNASWQSQTINSDLLNNAVHDIDLVYEATARFENMRIGQEQVRIGAAQLGEFIKASKEQHDDFQELIGAIKGERGWPK